MSSAPRTPRSVRAAAALFRHLTALMPRSYRRRHREEAVHLMTLLAADAHRARGDRGVFAVTVSAIGDLVARLPAEYVARRSHDHATCRAPGQRRRRDRVDAVAGDVRYALRSLRRRPLSSAAAIATMAIGIGLNAAVFSVVDWVLFRPLPYRSAEDLVKVFTAGVAPATAPAGVTHAEFLTFSRAAAFRASAAFSTATRVMTGQGLEPAHVVVARVAGDFFGTFEMSPQIGRGIDATETSTGSAVVVLSDTMWRNRFAGDPAIVGRTIAIDRRAYTVLGIMPAARGYPKEADVWRPLTTQEREDDDREYEMIGRLAGGTSEERASSEIATLARAASNGARRGWVDDVQRAQVRDVRAALIALLASSAVILLMTCANVASLVAARAADRSDEMALRGALGATHGRLLRQLLTESMLLATAGGTIGLMIGWWTLDVLVAIAPAGLPRLTEIRLDGRVLGLGAAATLAVGLMVGLAPAYHASRPDLRSSLSVGGSAEAPRRRRTRFVLVAAQTAMAVVLSMSAGLLARSLQHLATIDHGFDADRLLAVELALRGEIAGDERELFRELIAQAETIPGVRSAAVSLQLPTRTAGLRVSVRVNNALVRTPAVATLRPVTSRYFETIGVPLIAGRLFTADDHRTAPRIAVVNAAFVRDVLHGGQAVGARLTTDVVDGDLAVVGIVGNVTPFGQSDRPAVYVSLDQIAVAGGSLLVRTHGEPASVVPALKARLRGAAPALPLDRIRRLAESLEAGRAATRFNTQLASAFAIVALLLSVIGVYGLTAGEVAGRWRELAIRLALGATRWDAIWTAMRPGTAAVSAGLILGLTTALVVSRSMRSLLYGVEPADPPTFILVAGLLGIVGFVAASLAAARVVRADPAEVLRGG